MAFFITSYVIAVWFWLSLLLHCATSSFSAAHLLEFVHVLHVFAMRCHKVLPPLLGIACLQDNGTGTKNTAPSHTSIAILDTLALRCAWYNSSSPPHFLFDYPLMFDFSESLTLFWSVVNWFVMKAPVAVYKVNERLRTSHLYFIVQCEWSAYLLGHLE